MSLVRDFRKRLDLRKKSSSRETHTRNGGKRALRIPERKLDILNTRAATENVPVRSSGEHDMNSRLLSRLVTMILIATVSMVAAAQCTRCGPGLTVSPDGAAMAVTLRSVGLQPMAFNIIGSSRPPFAVGLLAATAAQAEPAPTNLSSYSFKRGLYDVVVLSWINHSNDADSIHVERCTGSTCTNFREIAVTDGNATSYVDSMWPMHLTFRYRVRAHGPTGYSAYSNIRTQATP